LDCTDALTSLGVKYAHNAAYLKHAEQLQLVIVFVLLGTVIFYLASMTVCFNCIHESLSSVYFCENMKLKKL